MRKQIVSLSLLVSVGLCSKTQGNVGKTHKKKLPLKNERGSRVKSDRTIFDLSE